MMEEPDLHDKVRYSFLYKFLKSLFIWTFVVLSLLIIFQMSAKKNKIKIGLVYEPCIFYPDKTDQI